MPRSRLQFAEREVFRQKVERQEKFIDLTPGRIDCVHDQGGVIKRQCAVAGDLVGGPPLECLQALSRRG